MKCGHRFYVIQLFEYFMMSEQFFRVFSKIFNHEINLKILNLNFEGITIVLILNIIFNIVLILIIILLIKLTIPWTVLPLTCLMRLE